MSSDQAAKPGSAKKLKQACLPFKLVNSPGAGDLDAKCRKRKLSGTENDETRVENPKVELVNGGAKCFIKSDGEDVNDEPQEISNQDVINEAGAEDSVKVVLSENSTEKTEVDIDLDSSKAEENMDVDNAASNSSDSNISLNNTSIVSTSESQNLGNTTPSAKKLTPNQLLKKKQESAKKEEERQRLKQEREKAKEEKLRLKQLEKEQKKSLEIEAKHLRELEKEREKKQKEEERKAKEIEKERERKQKEEEKKNKELEREKEKKLREEERKAKELEKEKEKKQKEEERKAKELEKEKLKEEKLLKEEMERKKNEKIKAAFVGFFKAKSSNLDSSKKDEEYINKEPETYFMPFQTKQDMKVAPFCRTTLNCDGKLILDKYISQNEKKIDLLYLNLLKTQKHKPSKSEATWPIQVEDDTDVIIIETGSTNDDEDMNKIGTSLKKKSCKYRWKLLQFHENKRPPYCGTWRKKSLYVKPRRPFACDKIMFDYEIDSDDEWEEDEGESIHGTDDEVEPEDDYEVDNDVFVPHGYLSDEEGEGDNDNVSEEVQKEKLKLLGEEFEAEIKKKTERIKPRLVGCIWIPNNVTNPENMSKSVSDTLLKYRCVWDGEEPIVTDIKILEESPKDGTISEDKKTYLPDSIIPNLITFVHGNTNGIKVAAKNFIDELVKNGQNVDDNSINLSSVRRAIKTIATKSTNLSPWSVGKDSFEKYGVEYSKILEKEVPKSSKFSAKKITSFMTSQNQKDKTTSLDNKLCTEVDHVLQSEKSEFVPKNLFEVKEKPKPLVKDVIKGEQKVNIVGGKKRITPVLISPKKNFKFVTDKEHNEKSLSPKIDCKIVSIPIDKTA